MIYLLLPVVFFMDVVGTWPGVTGALYFKQTLSFPKGSIMQIIMYLSSSCGQMGSVVFRVKLDQSLNHRTDNNRHNLTSIDGGNWCKTRLTLTLPAQGPSLDVII